MAWSDNWTPAPDAVKAEGGQGVVRKVINKSDSQLIGSLKVMHADSVKDSERVARFWREVEVLKTLNDPLLPKIYEDGEADGVPYFIEEWIEGKTLSAHLQKSGCYPIQKALTFIRILTKAVDSVHDAGVVHRDIKPENIIVDDNGTPHLVDFGICWHKPDEGEKDDKLTANGQEIGNRFLRLPEYCAGNRNRHSPVSDVTFLVGVLFYLVTGLYPRQLVNADGKMPHEALEEQLLGKLKNDALWEGLSSLFTTGFKYSIMYRYQSCMHLIEKIDSILKPPSMSSNKGLLEEMKSRLYEKFADDEKVKVLQELKAVWGRINSDLSSLIYETTKGVPGLHGSTNQRKEIDGMTFNHFYDYDTIEGRVFSYHLNFKLTGSDCRMNVRFDNVSFQNADVEYPEVITAPCSDTDLLWLRYMAMKDAIAANIIAAITQRLEQRKSEKTEDLF